MIQRRGKDIIYSGVIIAFLLLSFLYGIGRVYGFSIFPDEFGYWSSAARALGYDWSKISSLGSYYSFGYSLILIPILFVTNGAILAYRVAVTVNGLLLLCTFFILYRILKRLFPEMKSSSDRQMLTMAAGMAICYPVWLLYINMTLVEVLAVFGFTLVCDRMLRYLENGRLRDLICTLIAVMYLYTVHMRSVGIVIAAVLVICIDLVRRKKNRLPWLMVVCVILFGGYLLTSKLKQLTQVIVYADADITMLAVNDYAGQWHKILSLFSWKGISEFLVSLIGKILYLGLASFGLFYYGMYGIIRNLLNSEKGRKDRCYALFLLLSVLGEILICAIYMKGYGRIDALFYGRYDEFILPIVMALGVLTLLRMKHPGRILAGLLIYSVSGMALIQYIIHHFELTNIHGGYFMAGMSYLLRYMEFDPDSYLWKALGLALLFIAVLYITVLFLRKHREFQWLLYILIGLECLLGISLGERYTFSYNTVTHANIQFAEHVHALSEEENRRIVSYGNGDDDNAISMVQFVLRDTTIYLVPDNEFTQLEDSDLVIVGGAHGESEELKEYYTEQKAYGSFWLYYNE